MSQDQQYDYLKKMTIQRAGGDKNAWKSGDREVNITGIRSFSGTAHGMTPDKYDDMIYTARIVDGKKTVEGFHASVDPGKQSDGKRSEDLPGGFYDNAWVRGQVSGGEMGLRQARDIEAFGDKNGDGLLQPDEIKAGTHMLSASQQLQFHRGGVGNVGDSSAGFQVIAPKEYDRFQQILAEAPPSQNGFSYNLTDSSTLPGINADGSSQNTFAHRIRTSSGVNLRAASGNNPGIGRIRQPGENIQIGSNYRLRGLTEYTSYYGQAMRAIRSRHSW